MDWKHKEVCRTDPNCELRIGTSSWGNETSLKYAWFNANGSVARGGEFPLKALSQMMEFAIRCGYKFEIK